MSTVDASASPPVKPASDLPDENLDWPLPWPAIVLQATKEGLGPEWKRSKRVVSYLCQANHWTIGYGETAGVHQGMEWTKAQADENLRARMTVMAGRVRAMCKVPPNENQLGALCLFADNVGLGGPDEAKAGLYDSTVLARHNEGNFNAAARAFSLYNKYRPTPKSPLMVSNGLTARRVQEAAMYLTPVPNEIADGDPDKAEDMPQAVEPESSMAKSPINLASVIGGGGASVASIASGLSDHAETAKNALDGVSSAAASASGVMGTVRDTAASFGVPLNVPIIVGLVIAVVVVVVVWNRLKQRHEGFA